MFSENLSLLGPLVEKLIFFIPLGIEIESSFDHENQRIKLRLSRASNRYLNDQNATHGRKMTSVSRSTAQNKKSDYSKIWEEINKSPKQFSALLALVKKQQNNYTGK